MESAATSQSGVLSSTRFTTLGSSILAEIDAFFREFDWMSVSARHAEHFLVFDDVKVEFHGFRVSRGGVWFLEALWKKYGNCAAYLKLGVYIGGSMQTLLYCVLAHMERTKLEDVFEIHILEWKALVQEITREGFKFNFILNYLLRLAHDMFSRRILAELRAMEARAAALRNALSIIALDPWHLAFARGVFVEPHVGSALYGLLA